MMVQFSAALIPFLLAAFLTPQEPPKKTAYDQITAAYQEGRLEDAELQLRKFLEIRPADVRALGLMGVVLDGQKRYDEAESYYLKAVQLAPNSASLQNNLGNHYLEKGELSKARQAFVRALKIDPRHANANLQLVQINLRQKDYAAALRGLDRLASADNSPPELQLLRLQALYGAGEKEQAQALLAQLEFQAADEPRLAFSLGMAYVEMERYADAERTFTRVLQADPTNFEVLYNLATAALRAGHLERAAGIYQRALDQKPDDVDCLVGLARAFAEAGKDVSALPILTKANGLAPERTDILLLMAQASARLGYFEDTAIAYDKYLQLKPDDDVARRQRGLANALSSKADEGIRDLEWYVQRHPGDAQGHYLLATGLSLKDKAKSLQSLNRALQLDPQFWDARYGRGVLELQLHMLREAIADLQAYLNHEPRNAQALGQLGRAFLQDDQPEAAARFLKQAIDLDPENADLYFHYGRALRLLDRTQEMDEALANFKRLGGRKAREQPPAAGLFDYFKLSPAEQEARYVRNLQDAILRRPGNPEPRVLLAGVYLNQKKNDDALTLLDQVKQISEDVKVLARCGRLLVDSGLYANAIPFLENVIRKEPVPEGSYLDYALAVFRTGGAEKGLTALDTIPSSGRDGDYYLLRAQILDSLGRFEEAVEALNGALRAAPTRPDLYFQACSFLLKHKQYEESLRLLKLAEDHVAASPALMMARAITLEMSNQTQEAMQQLGKIQSQWPEWAPAYVVQGIILQSQHQAAEAKRSLETAIALRSTDPAAYYSLVLAIKDLTPNDKETAYKVAARGLALDPNDPYMQLEAGRAALDMKDYAAALTHLQEAARLYPEMSEAHWLLATLYRVTGEQEKQKVELAAVTRLNKLFPPGTQPPPSTQDLLFSVGKPGAAGGRRPAAGPDR